jgi:predicted nuclease of predicted toxin-antitoxin system
MRLLVDECLSPELAKLAQKQGYEASHVVWLKQGGAKDWELMPLIIDGDWTLVTNNSIDFRGPEGDPVQRDNTRNKPFTRA